jgi:hypothetical protein
MGGAFPAPGKVPGGSRLRSPRMADWKGRRRPGAGPQWRARRCPAGHPGGPELGAGHAHPYVSLDDLVGASAASAAPARCLQSG